MQKISRTPPFNEYFNRKKYFPTIHRVEMGRGGERERGGEGKKERERFSIECE